MDAAINILVLSLLWLVGALLIYFTLKAFGIVKDHIPEKDRDYDDEPLFGEIDK